MEGVGLSNNGRDARDGQPQLAPGGESAANSSVESDTPDEAEYNAMMILERLESLEEEMEDLGVKSLDEVRQRIEELHTELDQRG
jgi:hypothetical protein